MNVIQKLNAEVWATLAPSKLHGVGVVAIRDIPKGQRVYAITDNEQREWLECGDFADLRPEILKLIKQRWPLALKGEPFQSPNDDQRLTSFMNGSENPNYDPSTDTALRDIFCGDELTESYASMPELYEIT